jgi:hypothetical protein
MRIRQDDRGGRAASADGYVDAAACLRPAPASSFPSELTQGIHYPLERLADQLSVEFDRRLSLMGR